MFNHQIKLNYLDHPPVNNNLSTWEMQTFTPPSPEQCRRSRLHVNLLIWRLRAWVSHRARLLTGLSPFPQRVFRMSMLRCVPAAYQVEWSQLFRTTVRYKLLFYSGPVYLQQAHSPSPPDLTPLTMHSDVHHSIYEEGLWESPYQSVGLGTEWRGFFC